MNVSPVSSAHLLAGLTPEAGPRAKAGDTELAQRQKAAAQFEAVLVRQLIAPALNGMMGSSEGGAGGGGVYGYMLTDLLAEKITEGQGLGLSATIARQLSPRGSAASALTDES
jgi:flagellar protein FlgJ